MTPTPFQHSNNLAAFGNPMGAGLAPDTSALPAPARPENWKAGAEKKRLTGILAVKAGGSFSIEIRHRRDATGATAQKIRLLKAGEAKAKREQAEAHRAWVASITVERPEGDADMAKLATAAYDQAAAIHASRVGLEKSVAGPTTEVRLVMAQSPSLCIDAFAPDAEPQPHWVCLHDNCKGKRWETEKQLRGDHKTAKEYEATGDVHLVGLWSEMASDADDPDAGIIGLIAPVGLDGITAGQVAQMAAEGATTQHEEPAAEDEGPAEKVPRVARARRA
jgi:hypothetical protein